jgi:hypothetical protein
VADACIRTRQAKNGGRARGQIAVGVQLSLKSPVQQRRGSWDDQCLCPRPWRKRYTSACSDTCRVTSMSYLCQTARAYASQIRSQRGGKATSVVSPTSGWSMLTGRTALTRPLEQVATWLRQGRQGSFPHEQATQEARSVSFWSHVNRVRQQAVREAAPLTMNGCAELVADFLCSDQVR